MNWQQQRDVILQWWPVYLTDKPAGSMFLEGLEQTLWGCKTESDFFQFLRQIEKIWGSNPNQVAENIFLRLTQQQQPQSPLHQHFGVSLGEFLQHSFGQQPLTKNEEQQNKIIPWVEPFKQQQYDEAKTIAAKLQEQFSFRGIQCSQSVDPAWLKKQLTDCHIGLTTLSELFNIPKEAIGRNKLGLWFHQRAPFRQSVTSGDQLDILIGGGDVAKTWFEWVVSNLLQTNTTFELNESNHRWQQQWKQDIRTVLQRQQYFLDMSEKRFKLLIDSLDVTSDLSQKSVRRFKAFKKWKDDIERGVSLVALGQSWRKIKTGNKIAWSAEKEQVMFTQSWKRIEKSIERAFFTTNLRDHTWEVPAWVLVSTQHIGSFDITSPIQHSCALWGLGFEALIEEQLGYDSWLAQKKSVHPAGKEAHEFFEFFYQDLSRYLI